MIRFAAGALGRVLFLFPVFWLLYVTGGALADCTIRSVKNCVEMVATSPFYAIFPPILDIVDEPLMTRTPHLAILFAAVVASMAWQHFSSRRHGDH